MKLRRQPQHTGVENQVSFVFISVGSDWLRNCHKILKLVQVQLRKTSFKLFCTRHYEMILRIMWRGGGIILLLEHTTSSSVMSMTEWLTKILQSLQNHFFVKVFGYSKSCLKPGSH